MGLRESNVVLEMSRPGSPVGTGEFSVSFLMRVEIKLDFRRDSVRAVELSSEFVDGTVQSFRSTLTGC